MKTKEVKSELPKASQYVSSPLRNRIQLELNAPLTVVWNLVGDPARMPEYSEGLQTVKTKRDEKGNCVEYLCHFKPEQTGEGGKDHRALMKWYEPMKGWASLDEEPNLFGLSESLTLITLEEAEGKTILIWDMHYHAKDVEMNKRSLELALNNDIAKRLIDRFGGRVIASYIQP